MITQNFDVGTIESTLKWLDGTDSVDHEHDSGTPRFARTEYDIKAIQNMILG